jgi:Core-2/I-Branching enzyme
MKPPIGFALATFQNPEQTLSLCERLNAMFDKPPIAIHHDFSQSSLNTGLFPKNVHFVEKWVRTKWGNISVVDAFVHAFRLVYAKSDPDWVVNLSNSDHPIQTADFILRDLYDKPFDAFLDSRAVKDLGQPIRNEGLGEQSFRHPTWQQLGYNRYVAIPLCSPAMARRLRTPSEKLTLRSPFLSKRFTPFHSEVTCYGGDAWFTLSRRAAHILIDETPLWQRLRHHYRNRYVPEESFYHTVICNSPGLKISQDNKRYTDWRDCGSHPRILGIEDLPRLMKSTHHFARKFAVGPDLLRKIDEAVAHNDGAKFHEVSR